MSPPRRVCYPPPVVVSLRSQREKNLCHHLQYSQRKKQGTPVSLVAAQAARVSPVAAQAARTPPFQITVGSGVSQVTLSLTRTVTVVVSGKEDVMYALYGPASPMGVENTLLYDVAIHPQYSVWFAIGTRVDTWKGQYYVLGILVETKYSQPSAKLPVRIKEKHRVNIIAVKTLTTAPATLPIQKCIPLVAPPLDQGKLTTLYNRLDAWKKNMIEKAKQSNEPSQPSPVPKRSGQPTQKVRESMEREVPVAKRKGLAPKTDDDEDGKDEVEGDSDEEIDENIESEVMEIPKKKQQKSQNTTHKKKEKIQKNMKSDENKDKRVEQEDLKGEKYFDIPHKKSRSFSRDKDPQPQKKKKSAPPPAKPGPSPNPQPDQVSQEPRSSSHSEASAVVPSIKPSASVQPCLLYTSPSPRDS